MADFKPRPGSQLAAEAKEDKIVLGVAALIVLGIALAVFVFNTDLRDYSRRAGTLLNVIGGACFVGSWLWMYFMAKNYSDGKNFIAVLLLIIAGIVVSCGANFGR